MEQKDTASLRKCFTPGVQFTTYSYDSKSNPRAKGIYLNDFLRQVSLIGESDVEEKLTGWQSFIDDGIASVWAPYEFYYDKKFTHCGVNSIQVIKVQGEWKINQISDTRRKQDCIDVNKTKHEIDSLINQWHHAAAIADESAYFGRMAEDGVYIGTDAGERWTKEEFETWSKKYFDSKSTWDFKPLSRNITIAPGGQIAWFDELLDTWMGTCRSTGIMEFRENEWRIVHYQLSIAVPNDSVKGYLKLIGK
jgi:ketosteroid isomerase-like protein